MASQIPDPIESPCVRICTIDPGTQTCLGCFRTLREIAGWTAYSPALRRSIMDELPARAARVPADKLTRSG